MRKSFLPGVLGLLFAFAIIGLLFGKTSRVDAATNHIVISQIQTRAAGTGQADNEFIELYNPTNSPISLSKWKLKRETMNGSSTSANLVASMSGTIQAHGYFLIGSPESVGSISADVTYSTGVHITDNNTVLLYNASDSAAIDKVGMESATDFEASAAANPNAGGSIQRKVDDTNGHGLDTDNNSTDFENLTVATPRNSSVVITPTSTPSPTPTLTPSPTLTPTPTDIPTNTPTPTMTPTVTPSETPTGTPSATPTISATPTSTPSGSVIDIPRFQVQCATLYMNFNFGFFTVKVPYPVCKLVALK